MAPWLIIFTLVAFGIDINLVGIIFFLVASIGTYIWLGVKLRQEAQSGQILTPNQVNQMTDAEHHKSETPNEGEKSVVNKPEVKFELPKREPAISKEDLDSIKSIFGIDTFFATETLPMEEGVVFKGNLRGEADLVHDTLTTKLNTKMPDRYNLFLVEGTEEKPVVIILPSDKGPQPLTLAQKNLALVLLVATLFTSLESAGILLGFDLFNHWERLGETIPIAIGLWAVLIGHEIGHYLPAQQYGVNLSWPFFIPNWQLGSFGAITRFQSVIQNRSILFDIAAGGPIAGGLISLFILLVGFSLSHEGSFFQVPSDVFQGSILVGTLAKLFLGDRISQTIIDLNPLAIIGWLGLVITALNLIPAGKLDGGRMMQSIYGRKTAGIATAISLGLLLIIGFVNFGNPVPLYWAILVLFLQRSQERPPLNELTEPDDTRAAIALISWLVMLAILIPLNPSLALNLGIGN
jgi:membrane-associated protease RseP (regulator of RpoE activity)